MAENSSHLRKVALWMFGAAAATGGLLGAFNGVGTAVAGAIALPIVVAPLWILYALIWWVAKKSRKNTEKVAAAQIAPGAEGMATPPASPPNTRTVLEPYASTGWENFSGRSKSGVRWVAAGEPVSVGSFRIDSGMFYLADGSSDLGEASLINTKLPLGRPARGDAATLGYWTDYGQISPEQRAAYLEWLALGRRDTQPADRNFGYLFLFFYGIERRLLVDRQPEPRAIEALADMMRLYAPHGKSKSLPSYTCQLFHFWGVSQGAAYYSEFWPWILGLPSRHVAEDDLALILANLVETGRTLTQNVAFEIAMNHEEARRSTVLTRVPQEFRELFDTRFRDQFPDGMVLRAAKRPRRVEYRPANPTLLQMNHGRSRAEYFERSIAHVHGVPSQFKPLVTIWNSCIDDLSAYSRAKGKTDGFSIKAQAALPAELRGSADHPLNEQWRGLLPADDFAREGFAIIKLASVAALFGQEKRPKLTATQARELAVGIETLGFAVEPDPRLDGSHLKWEEELGVFPNPNGSTPKEHSSALAAAKALLTLCFAVAVSDGHVEESELAPIRGIIEEAAGLHADEHRRLVIAERLLSRDPVRARVAAGKVAKAVPRENRELVADLLVRIACADGIVTKDERRALLKLFKDLQLDEALLDSLIRRSLTGFEESEVIPAGPAPKGEAIPRPGPAKPGVRLDFERIASITKETHEVIAVLSTVMLEEDEPTDEAVPAGSAAVPDASAAPGWLGGLEMRYQPLVLHVAGRASLSRTEFEAVCAEFHLMPTGAFDAVNEWAEDALGDFLLEGEDEIDVALHILPKEQ